MRGFALATIAALVGVACGYAPVRYGGSLGAVRSVSVSTPENLSFEPGVEFVIAEALRREFLRRGAVELSDDPAAADLVLSGSIERVEVAGRSFSSVVLALEYEVVVDLEVRATLRDGSAVPMDAAAMTERERYLASADVEALRKNREEAVRRVASLLAGRVHDALYEALAP